MITGYNTDIDHNGVTYHVQTEDKGLSKPVIMSLVYDRGTILASRRVPYDDLIADGFDEKVLESRLQRQHNLICAAIRAGRIEDLKAMTARDTAAVRQSVSEEPANGTNGNGHEPQRAEPAAVPRPDTGELAMPIPRPEADANSDLEALMAFAEPIVDVVGIIEDDVIVIPDHAVAIVSDMAGRDRPGNDKLSIEMIGETTFRGGDRRSVGFMVCRGSDRKVVPHAQIMVKILGSSFRPLIFHAATDQNGIAKVNLQFPSFKSGRAAFLVRAMSEGEEVELRRPIVHG